MATLPEMIPVLGSSQISHMGHDAGNRHLYVQFWRKPTESDHANPPAHFIALEDGKTLAKVPGPIYRYDDISVGEWAALNEAESKGKHFGANIKGNFTHTKVSG